jgi:hypothetical protein
VKPLAFALAALLLAPLPLAAQQQSAPPPQQPVTEADPDAPQPKFIWGILLIKFAAGEVFSNFTQWTWGKISGKPSENKTMTAQAVDYLRGKSDTTGGAYVTRNLADPMPGFKETPPITMDRPSTPIVISQGAPNYQGVHISIVGADRAGNITDLRPVNAGFKTGERFKLRAVSTFGGHMIIENINPKGERRQIYPAERDSVIVIQPGADTLLPLGKDQFFEFARATGEEQLVITLRDPRAIGAGISKYEVNRKDEEYGSNFVQQVDKDSYPLISQAIRLQHSAN